MPRDLPQVRSPRRLLGRHLLLPHNHPLRWVLLISSLLAAAAVSARATSISGTVTDAISARPLQGVHVQLWQRPLIVQPDGTQLLSPWGSRVRLQTAIAGPLGCVRFDLTGSQAARVYAVTWQANSFLPRQDILILVRAGQDISLNEHLFPQAITVRQQKLWLARHEHAKRVRDFSHPDFIQTGQAKSEASKSLSSRPALATPRKPKASGSVTFPVPVQVQVVDLAGTGFTGRIDLDEYVAGAVAGEMGEGFPFEALKAQAVASRTFALNRLATRGRANGGQAFLTSQGVKSQAAAQNTSGVVVLYQGNIIPAYFSARCNGDWTLNSEDGPTLADCRVGGLGAGVLPWARARPCSGHVNCSVTAEPCCEIVVRGETNHLFGHGVGLCQRGAQDYAGRDGHTWEWLLHHYYTDIEIANAPGLGPGDSVTTTVALNVRSAACGSRITSVPRGTAGILVAGPQRPLCPTLASPFGYLTWWRVRFTNGTEGWAVEDYLQKSALLNPETVSLTVERGIGDGNLIFSWPADAGKGPLEQTKALIPSAQWEIVPTTAIQVGRRIEVTISAGPGERFFRLLLQGASP